MEIWSISSVDASFRTLPNQITGILTARVIVGVLLLSEDAIRCKNTLFMLNSLDVFPYQQLSHEPASSLIVPFLDFAGLASLLDAAYPLPSHPSQGW